MAWKLIVDDTKANLFPFAYWPDSYSTGWKEIIGRDVQHTLLEFKYPQFRYFIDEKEWRIMGELVFSKISDTEFGEKVVEENRKRVNELMDYCTKIERTEFPKLGNDELAEINEEYSERILSANQWGLFISVMEYGNNILSERLEDMLKKKIETLGLALNNQVAFATLVTPRKDNITQQEIKEFNALVSEFKGFAIKNPEGVTFHSLAESHPKFHDKIARHANKYCWIRYNYEGPALTAEQFFDGIINAAGTEIRPESPMHELAERQDMLEAELMLGEKEKNAFSMAREFMHWKTMRRDVQSFAFYVFEGFLREIARRFSLTMQEARMLHYKEVGKMLRDDSFKAENLRERLRHAIYLLEAGQARLLVGDSAREKARELTEEHTGKTDVLGGNCAMPGKVTGTARVINNESDFQKFIDGDIIVSFATTPGMAHLIRRSSGIITDQGGITCHAAIISRELGIPCIVGTKIATKALKDGDIVELDAANGVARVKK